VKRRVLNAFPAMTSSGAEWLSQFFIETTALPEKIRIRSFPRKMDRQEHVIITLSGLGLTMAPDDILVADGLIKSVTVNQEATMDGREAAALRFSLEHLVIPDVRWFRRENPGRPDFPYTVEFAFSRAPLRSLFKDRRIAIDPGHGGKDRGVRGPVNLLEKDVALEISILLASLLEVSGAVPVLTRKEDISLREESRLHFISQEKPELYIRVHTAGSKDPLSQEYHIMVKPGCPQSTRLGALIQEALRERMGMVVKTLEQLTSADLRNCPCPVVQVEPLCLSHFVDEANFRAPLFKKRIAQAIYNGIARYLASSREGIQRAAGDHPVVTVAGGAIGAKPQMAVASGREISFEIAPEIAPITGEDRAAEKGGSWKKATIFRIRTHLLTASDDIVEVVKRYTKDIASPGDLVGISESVVAITQGRAIPPEEIKPGLLAKILSRFAHPDASISAVRSMQKAMEIAGTPRILLAAVAGLLGKATGIRGLFFKVAGHEVAEIDDSGGTMPPYDRHVILGPKDPTAVAKRIWKKVGLWALILDTNDKGAVDILGTSFPLEPERKRFIETILKENPFGNDDQKTPIVVIRPG